MRQHELHDFETLKYLSERRGRTFDPALHFAWCGECGASMSMFGVLHAPECDGDDSDIRFKNR